ncbi:MAG: hypothetical protein U1O81_07915 [Planktothrix rubescens PR223]|jgi:hypothetical protein
MKTTLNCLLILATLIIGCRKEETPATAAPTPSLIGFWKMSAYENIWMVSPPNQSIETGSDTGSLQIRFHADSTYRVISTHSGIPGDTGRFVVGNGAIGLISTNVSPLPTVLYSPRYNFDTFGRLLLNFPEYKEYTLNDTGAAPVLGDYTTVVHTYTFVRQ